MLIALDPGYLKEEHMMAGQKTNEVKAMLIGLIKSIRK